MENIPIQPDPKHIEYAFKVEEPFTVIGDGYFGYKGVVLRDKEKDLLQCHICGQWYEALISHVRLAHKMKALNYRMKFGLPINYPLCSHRLSEIIRETSLLNKERYSEAMLEGLKKARTKIVKKKQLKHLRYSLNNPAFENKNGACMEQLKKRYLIVADIVGHDPSKSEIDEHDKSLNSMIFRKHGSINNFREKANFQVRKKWRNGDYIYSEEFLLGKLREFARIHNRAPSQAAFSKHFDKPDSTTYVTRFGSWQRALRSAGLVNDIYKKRTA